MAKLPSAERVVQSYLAARPLNTKLQSVKKGDELPGGWVIAKPGYVITGELRRGTVQIFAHPDRVIEDFANTTNEPQDILRFTQRYGVLHRRDREWFDVVPGEAVAGDRFLIHCGQWLQSQEKFRAEWEMKGKPNEKLAQELEEQINPKSQSGRVVKAFVTPGKTGGFQVELRPDDLLGALWLAFLGYSDRTRKCLNPTCSAPYFIASRRDQRYCNEACSRLVANRKWWTEKGAQWRESKLKKEGRNV